MLLGGAYSVLGLLTVAGLVAGAVVGAVAAAGPAPWRGDIEFISAGMAVRLALGILLGVPFTLLAGWAAAVVLRSTYKAVLVVEGTLLIYVLTVRWTYLSAVGDAIYRYSPWGSLMAMLVGEYRPPQLTVGHPPSLVASTLLTIGWSALLLLAVAACSRRGDVGGGGSP